MVLLLEGLRDRFRQQNNGCLVKTLPHAAAVALEPYFFVDTGIGALLDL
jgi:hypothetical protein